MASDCARLYTAIDSKAVFLPSDSLDSNNPPRLLARCRCLASYAKHLASWAPEYDHEKCEMVNGYWLWLRTLKSFAKVVLKSCEVHGIKVRCARDELHL